LPSFNSLVKSKHQVTSGILLMRCGLGWGRNNKIYRY